MAQNDPLQGFEDFLEADFQPLRFANDLLKVTNNGTDTDVLDLKTCVKRCSYDLQELDRRIEGAIKTNPSHVLEQIEKRKKEKSFVGDTLKSNTEYLSMSYNRLQQDILEPFERALKLQTVSSKIHQTTTLLRSSLIYVHMISQLQMMPLETDSTDDEQLACGLKIAALHSQLKINIEQNPNLATLQLIKSCENNVVSPNRQELLRYLSTNLTRDCLNNLKMENNPKRIVTLIKALYTLSPVDLFDTIDKVLSSKIQTTAQVLSKTITSIRNFNLSLDDAMENRNSILTLQNLMEECEIEGNTNTLRNYLSQRKFSSLIDQFWSKVTNSFKRDFEMSYNRGGPVGKSLQSNSNLIYEAISKCFGENDPSNELQGELQYILKAVSILDTNRK
ncbi:Golgi transport complex subunit COG5 [Kluyveromyces lactis]|uniref:Conserved oligomeric Golgi complex subunit 5 n=1 Tax=Kluyveromyces lactis (strain ATCC 8585 / CBS 2359 / DSM 70799 / NBRC 1267 / NRRL Y-1140 / WM37) TaxID=284590 RepID=Q6CLE2_KLULA|nr:uncharacterized protein KLLA0_F03685g [Kluyveromyces lactis]CAG97955.1 KLLA0F03685p [Kluyveromyces lactis]|eukprot:XP_455247.1 uncharacterized protein KLLA0_F03685g [Kluyveromyces lactis]